MHWTTLTTMTYLIFIEQSTRNIKIQLKHTHTQRIVSKLEETLGYTTLSKLKTDWNYSEYLLQPQWSKIRNGQKKKLGKCLTIWKLDSTLLNNSNLKRRNDKGKKKAFWTEWKFKLNISQFLLHNKTWMNLKNISPS